MGKLNNSNYMKTPGAELFQHWTPSKKKHNLSFDIFHVSSLYADLKLIGSWLQLIANTQN